jgi:hypothetical protein
VHGFGFAGALREYGLPQGALVPALAAFNIGVEIGQIAIVALVFPLLLLRPDQRCGRGGKGTEHGFGLQLCVAPYQQPPVARGRQPRARRESGRIQTLVR